MKIKKGQIDNEVAYYRVVEQNMIRQDNNKMARFKEHEVPLDEEFVFKKYDIDEELASRTMIGWIELIHNEALCEAVKSLPLDDQIFISYIFKEGKNQCELAKIYNIAQQNISKRFSKIIKHIRKVYAKGRNLRFS